MIKYSKEDIVRPLNVLFQVKKEDIILYVWFVYAYALSFKNESITNWNYKVTIQKQINLKQPNSQLVYKTKNLSLFYLKKYLMNGCLIFLNDRWIHN